MKQPPRAHVFGHIHHSYGSESHDHIENDDAVINFYNVAMCNEDYQPVNPIVEFEI